MGGGHESSSHSVGPRGQIEWHKYTNTEVHPAADAKYAAALKRSAAIGNAWRNRAPVFSYLAGSADGIYMKAMWTATIVGVVVWGKQMYTYATKSAADN